MAWVLIPGALRRIRDRKKLLLMEVAQRAKLSVRQLQRLERGLNKPTDGNLRELANALECERTDLAYRDDEPPPPVASSVRTGESTTLAKLEVERRLNTVTVDVRGKHYPVIGFSWLLRCETEYAEIDERLVVVGTVREGQAIPADAAAMLKAEQGRGAGFFRIRRDVVGLRKDGGAEPLYLTVYAPKGADGKRLQHCVEKEIPVKVLVQIVTRRATDTRRGFPRCEPASRIWPWAFVAMDVLTD